MVAPFWADDWSTGDVLATPLLQLVGTFDCDVGTADSFFLYRPAWLQKQAVWLGGLGHFGFNTVRDIGAEAGICESPPGVPPAFMEPSAYTEALAAYSFAFVELRARGAVGFRDLFTGTLDFPWIGFSLGESVSHEFFDPTFAQLVARFEGESFSSADANLDAPPTIECEREVSTLIVPGPVFGPCIDNVLTLAWSQPSFFSFSFAAAPLNVTLTDFLTFRVFQWPEDPRNLPLGTEKSFTVTLATGAFLNVEFASIPLSDFALVSPWSVGPHLSPSLGRPFGISRTIRIPLEAFLIENEDLDLAQVTGVTFFFGDGMDLGNVIREAGRIGIDDVYFSR